ncbi:hypothetical protein PG2093B_0900 [Bifidobacterium pseudolongum subsp. globosum]|uniref:Tryptophan-rich sensory protein n=1 Tax=Bifidobacterium pseudolongum subsp. globosum TaxID=1690 RepID=A0A4Q5A109_9BIFI|nr:hypothetical protein [Bifidobacterium pseudolongum]RYQ10317.1 hypothetical protein PG2093B_0900 [Bifidobacterium pseudolongum subsp. globosum]
MTQDTQPDTEHMHDAPPAAPTAQYATGTTPEPVRNTTPEPAKGADEHKATHDIEVIIAWVMLLAMIVINALAQFGMLVHTSPDDTRASVFAWFAPDRYVQLIWVPIYVLLAIWLIRIGNGRRKAKRLGRTPFTLIGLLFIVTAGVEIGWIFAWHSQNYPSAISLVLIQTALVWALWFFSRRGKMHSFWDWAPFSLWGAWLLVECFTDIARAATYYVSKDGAISTAAQSVTTIVVIVLLLALACFARYKFGDWIFGLVTLWSVVGVAIRLMDVSKITAVLGIALATAAAVLMYIPWARISPRLSSMESSAAKDHQGGRTHEEPHE